MVVPAVGIFILCDGMRDVPSSTTPVCRDHGSSAGVFPAVVGSAHMPHARPRRSRRWPARHLTRAHLEDPGPSDAPICSSSARATRSIAFQDTPTHVLAWCLVMFPLVCHCVALWMEVVHPGVLAVAAIEATVSAGHRHGSRCWHFHAMRGTTCYVAWWFIERCFVLHTPFAHLTVLRTLRERLRSMPSSAG